MPPTPTCPYPDDPPPPPPPSDRNAGDLARDSTGPRRAPRVTSFGSPASPDAPDTHVTLPRRLLLPSLAFLATLGSPASPDAPDTHVTLPRRLLLPSLAFLATLALPASVRATMDIANNGPILDAGRFAMRITNIGVIGNAFFNKGLSFDPSFEFPGGSGHECLEHAELWVGATRDDGTVGVSGGPMFEWRPTLDTNDVVLRRYAGD